MNALVTGGGGFLGRRICEMLLEAGHGVTSFSRSTYPELEALGARCRQGDLTDLEALRGALAGSEVVFHVAARAGFWGPRKDYLAANLQGTKNVLAACRAEGVRRLVYTSSPSACFDGSSHRRVSGDLPLSTRFLAAYPESKALAEAEVIAANGQELATVALRPHLIFGPRDPHLIPRLLERAASGRLAIIGKGDNEVSMTHVENAAWAHLCAAEQLHPQAACAGKGYFVAQRDPVLLWDWIQQLLSSLQIPPIKRRVPRPVAYGAGALCELLWRLAQLKGEPPMTRFVAMQLGTSHSYEMDRTQAELGYQERISMTQATEELIRHHQQRLGVSPQSG